MKPLRVLHCSHALSGGGAERQLSLLCEHGATFGLEQTTLYVEPGKTAIPPTRSLIRHHRRRKLDLSLFAAVHRAIDDVQPDIIHAWLPPVTNVPACVVGRQRGVPVVTSFRSAKRFDSWLEVTDFAVTWACGAGLISNTPLDSCTAPYQRLFRRKHGRVIANAVDVPDRDTLRANTPRDDGLFNLIFVGRIVPAKNWSCLVSALSLLPENTRVRLSVCGDGHERAAFEKQVNDKGLDHLVRFEGFVNDVYQRIANADALVLPSWREGMPNVVVESMALSTPTILSDIGANRAVVRDSRSSLIFDPTSPIQLAEKIEQLANDPTLAATLVQRGEKVASEYSLERMVSGYRDYYDEVVTRAGR